MIRSHKTLLLTAVFLSISAIAISQNKTPQQLQIDTLTDEVKPDVIFRYDFATKKLYSTTKAGITKNQQKPFITKGGFYKVQVVNVNQNLFKISLTTKDTVISKAQNMPTYGGFETDAISKLIAGLSPLSTSITEVERKIGQAGNSVEIAKNMPFQSATNSKKVSIKPNDQQQIKDEINSNEEKLKSFLAELQTIKTQIDEIQLSVYTYELQSLLLKPTGDCKSDIDYCTALKKMLSIRQQIADLVKRVTAASDGYNAFSDSKKDAIAKDDNFKKADSDIKAAYAKYLSTLSDALTAINADKVKELISRILIAQNNSSTTYETFPIQFMGEQAKISLTISPRNDANLLQTYKSDIKFPISNRSYAALGMSFYGSTLHDDAYSILGSRGIKDTVTAYNIKNEQNSKSELGIAAMLRVGSVSADEKFGKHLSFGTGISITNKIKPRMLVGGGIAYGKTHMITLDAGLIAGYVDRLSSIVDLSKTYYQIKPDPIVVSKLNYGAFGSIGYLYRF